MAQRLLRVLSLLAVSLYVSARSNAVEDDAFIGWKGNTYKPKDFPTEDVPELSQDKKPWVQVLSWRPRAFIYHNFLSDSEAAHIIKLAAPQMKRSTVVGAHNQGVVDDIRTSAGTFLMRNQDPVVTAIEQRLAVWVGLPPSHQEDMQVLRYGPTNKYGPHIDGLGRVCTVLIYLVPPEEGGETAFPRSDAWIHPEAGEPMQGNFSQCAKGHVAYKPRRGDALLFFDRMVDGKSEDQASTHTGCPVLKGVKWNAVKWIHPTPFREEDYNRTLHTPFTPQPDPGICTDRHEMCQKWAQAGECQKNAGYMLGGNVGQGMCRLACKDCIPCKPNDRKCIVANREKGGYLNFDEAELKLAEVGCPPGTVLGNSQ